MLGKDQQLIIAISREFGSGGKEIANYLGEYYNLPVYEKNLLQSNGVMETEGVEAIREKDDAPRWMINSRIRGLTNSNEELMAAMEFELMQDMANEGKSFIVLGHCAEEILKGNPALVTFFISADESFKLPRIMEEHQLSLQDARKMMKRHNRKRKSYHNYYCNHAWGDSRYYEMCLRSDKLGCQRTALLLKDYVDQRFGKQEV